MKNISTKVKLMLMTMLMIPAYSFSQKKTTIILDTTHAKSLRFYVYEKIGESESYSLDSAKTKIEIEIENPININFVSNRNVQNLIYLFPDDTLTVSLLPSGYEFKGKRNDEWNFSASLSEIGFPLIGFKEWDFGSVPYEDYLDSALARKSEIFRIIEKKQKILNFSHEFNQLLYRDIESAFLKSLIRNHNIYGLRQENSLSKISHLVSDYKDFFIKDSIRNSIVFEYAMMDWSAFMARNITSFKAPVKSKTYNERLGWDYAENFDIRLDMAREMPEPIRSEIMYKLISFRFLTNSWETDFSSYVNDFDNISSNKRLKDKLNSLSGRVSIAPRSETEKSMSTDVQVANTKLLTKNEETITWQNLIQASSGKVIYVDVWASWCAPCIREIRESARFNDEIRKHEDQLTVVHLSIDENLDMWHKAIDKLGISDRENYKMNLDSGLGDLVVPDKTIPKHFVIDKKGKLRTLEAPSLGSPAFLEMIERLIDEK